MTLPMTLLLRRLAFWGTLAALVVVGLVFAFAPRPISVDMATVERGTLTVTVDDEGETRVHDIYVLSAPVAGNMRRINAHVGDPVVALETIVTQIEPTDPAFLDPRSEAQAEADIRAAQSALTAARAEVAQAEAALEFADREHARARELAEPGTISQSQLDEAERNLRIAEAAHANAIATLAIRTYQLERARAALVSPSETDGTASECTCVAIRSPVNGQILRILQQSAGVVAAGDPLVEIGDAHDLEIVVDLLSSDAVKTAPGQRVVIERWGGPTTLEGRVRLVEPFGFTKVSALGIEEQRVNVVIDITSPADEWQRLAHGYQVDVRIVLAEREGVLKLPLLALVRNGEDWAVYVDRDGRAELTPVQIGMRSSLDVEIVDGLEEGDRIVLHPSNRIETGVRIAARTVTS